MRKSYSTLTTFGLVLLASSSVAFAASNAQLTVTATVAASTCDVSLSTNNLELGNYSTTDFTQIATPIARSTKNFTVGLNNCEAPALEGDTASLVVTGQTLGGNPDMFNSTGTNTGIMLSQADSPTTYIKAGDKLTVATASSTPSAADFNAKTLSLQAGLASTSLNANIGAVSAPILFSFAYN